MVPVSRLRTGVALVVLLAFTAVGHGVPALGAPPSPSRAAGTAPRLVPGTAHVKVPGTARGKARGKAQRIRAEQSAAASAGKTLGLGRGEKLVVKDVISDADGWTHVRYDRTFDGLRVIGGDLVSHRDSSGRTEGVSWNRSQRVAVASTAPRVSRASARATGARKAAQVQKTTLGTKSELVVYSGGASRQTRPRLAYEVVTKGVRADQTPSRIHTILDAKTGATLKSFDEIENATGHGIHTGTVSIGTTAGPPWSMRDTVGNFTTDLKKSLDDTRPGSIFTDANNIWGNGAVSDPASAAVDAQYGAEKTFDYFKLIQGRNGIRGNGAGARSRVHFGSGYVNAFWDGSQMTYGDGAGDTHPLTEIDVAGHEMTHGVTENTAGLVGDGEAGGLNEATSDIFGTEVEWYANNPADKPDYLIGEKVNVNGNGTPLRYLDKPSRDGASPNCWSSSLRGLDSHFSGGPLNHWFYLASEGSGAKVINGVSYNSPTCNALKVTPIGRAKAAKIWYRTLTTYLTSSNGYAAAREGAIQSAKDLYGATSPECFGVAASFAAVGVPAGAAACVNTAPPAVCNNLVANPGLESGGSPWSPTPGVIGVWGSGTRTPHQPAHSGTRSAWLGGFDSFRDDSISQLVRIPAGSRASLSYYVHVDTREAPTGAFDTMTVRAGPKALQTLSNLNAAGGYQHKTVNLSAYVGRTISLSFTGSEDGSIPTSFVVDDISLTNPGTSTVPGAPTAVRATPGNARAAVSWTAPVSNGGCPVTGYTVTAAPGGRTAGTTGARTSTVTGLVNGTSYTFRVTAANAAGTSAASAPSARVTPATVPAAPTGVLTTAANTAAVASWKAPAGNGGSAITGYAVRVVNAGTGTQLGVPRPVGPATRRLAVTGLANGTTYKLQVLARNVAGSGAYSAWSNIVKPAATAAVTRLSDFNRDGFTDLVGRDRAGALWLYPGNGAGGTLTRHMMASSGWAAMKALVTPGDVTGDGNADLVARKADGILWLYPGNGAGGLGARREIGSGWQRYTVTNAANLNGAGPPDLLGRSSTGVLWLYPFRSHGTLGRRTQIGTGWNGYTILGPGDVSGDQRADILARDRTGSLWLYRGNGAGRVAARTRVSTGWQTRTALVTPGNWDRAVGNDLLTRSTAGGLSFSPGDNAGHFGPPPLISTGWKSITYIG
jgi:Zn-dependent metalloprotease